MGEILQKHLPNPPWMLPQTRRLPGIAPIEPGDWLRVDDAYATQMAERVRLVGANTAAVYASVDGSYAACREVLRVILHEISTAEGYVVSEANVVCPDGRKVALDWDHPLLCAGMLVQEDLCVLQKRGAEYDLTAAILCFPASWTLAEKIDRPMTAIHEPVHEYTDDIAKRVARMFDAIHPDRPLWRANALRYADATLFQPRSMMARRIKPTDAAGFIRSERQSLLRLL